MALSISQLVNDYGSYSGKTLIGIRGARKTVPGSGFGGIQGVPYDNITFIVKVNGTRYASSRWLSQQQNGNPYIHKTSVARIDLQDIPYAPIDSITDIIGAPKELVNGVDLKPNVPSAANPKRGTVSLKQGEQFAEVNATSKLTTDDAILSFINDLLSESPDVKPWKTYGDFEPKIYTGAPAVPAFIENKLGEPFPVGVTTSFGGTYNPELDMSAQYPGMEFQRESVSLLGISGEEARALSVPNSSNSVVDTDEILIPPIEIEPIDLSDFELDPIDLGDFDFGLGNLDLGNFNMTMGNLNPISSGFGDFNSTGLASLNALSNEGGLASVGLGSYLTDYSGQPLGLMSDANYSRFG